MNSSNFIKENSTSEEDAILNNENNSNSRETKQNDNFISGEPIVPDREPPAPKTETDIEEAKLGETITELVKQKEKEGVTTQKEAGFLDESISSLKKLLGVNKKKTRPTHIPQVRDTLMIQIEHIMEEGLQEAYKELSTVEQQEFKIKGEETAWEIRSLLKQAKLKIKTIFKLLVSWLMLLPGVNRFFLEQEAKIKVDKIISLKNNKLK